MKSLNVAMISDADSWWDKEVEVPQTAHESAGDTTWLSDRPSIFDTRHDQTLLFAETRKGVSRCGVINDFPQDALFENIPMGYTGLTLREKRAVIVNGRVARLWPGERQPQGYAVSTVDDAGLPLSAGHTSLLWHGVELALRWSAVVTDRPFIVATLHSSQAWH